VLWSYGAGTALAEAEVEYKEKTSPAMHVAFQGREWSARGAGTVRSSSGRPRPGRCPRTSASPCIPRSTYLRHLHHEDGRRLVLVDCRALLEAFRQDRIHARPRRRRKFKGSRLNGSRRAASLPADRTSKVITGDFVTADTGTGAVHIAPGPRHGRLRRRPRTNSDSFAGR
jgi:isoleucyl-tRNA synthetase